MYVSELRISVIFHMLKNCMCLMEEPPMSFYYKYRVSSDLE
jgi:hypothetical protein